MIGGGELTSVTPADPEIQRCRAWPLAVQEALKAPSLEWSRAADPLHSGWPGADVQGKTEKWQQRCCTLILRIRVGTRGQTPIEHSSGVICHHFRRCKDHVKEPSY